MHLEELQMENEYQLRLKDMNYNEKMKEISDTFSQQIESLKNTQQVCQAACSVRTQSMWTSSLRRPPEPSSNYSPLLSVIVLTLLMTCTVICRP